MNRNKSTDLTWFLNGKYLKSSKVTIPVSDLSVTRGYGVFDFLRTYYGKPFMLPEHLHRLSKSAKILSLELPFSHQAISEVIAKLIKMNKLNEANIKIVLTGGLTFDGITPAGNSSFAVLVSPITIYPKTYFSQGIKIITVRAFRTYPEAKSLNYLQGVLAMIEANKQGAVEAVYVDEEENVLEATRSNIFAFFRDTLVTPKNKILDGISRLVVMKIMSDKFSVIEEDLPLVKLLAADEVFITSSTKEIMPVVWVDGKIIGRGIVGENTKVAMKTFRQFTDKYSRN